MMDDRAAETTIQALIGAQAAARPDRVAVVCEGTSLTYAELDRRADRVAARLRRIGVARDTLVAIGLERSLDMIVGLLGILKSGAAYLPIDPAYPKERLEFMLADAAPKALITSSTSRAQLPHFDASVILMDGEWDEAEPATPAAAAKDPGFAEGDADALAYVIYTSGSTGKPKGCQLTQRNVVRLFTQTEAWFHFDENDVWTFFHSHAFDFSVWEIWGALVYGGRVVVVPHAVSRSPRDFRALLVRERVTVLNQTPSAFRMLIEADAASGVAPEALALRYVIFGGEALELQMLKPWFDRHGDARPLLVNMYGITETTVHVTYRPIRRTDLEARRGSVIGQPIPDLKIWVLDPDRKPVAAGEVGEMYISGAGVCSGYLNRAELTAERFISWFPPGAASPIRLYKTGDLARRLPDGDLEYQGRIDHQVKIRGFRIETGEIESQLATHPSVRACAVIARSDRSGDKRLVAYLVAAESNPELIAELRTRLRATLPDHMMPAHFVVLESLPMTANGKLDRDALPAPSDMPRQAGASIAPRDATELKVWTIWHELLGTGNFGVRDNFFDVGGNSLLSMQLHIRLEKQFSTRFPFSLVLEAPTVELLCSRLQQNAERSDSLVTIRPGNGGPALFMVHDGYGGILSYRTLAHLLRPGIPVYGLSPVTADGVAMVHTRIRDIAASYVARIQLVQPHGPYLLGGLCAGGVIAHEMARQLQRAGEEIGMLSMMDAHDVAASKRTGQFARNQIRPIFGDLKRGLSPANPLGSAKSLYRFGIRILQLVRHQVAVRAMGRWSRVKALVLRHYLDRGLRPPKFARDLSVDEIYTFAEAGHTIEHGVEGDMVLFRASQGNGDVGDEPYKNLYTDHLLGWSPRVSGQVHCIDIEGGHYSMLQEPNVRSIAKQIQRHIDDALRKPRTPSPAP